ncbi:hypothetical protein F3J34_30480 [Klebsiella sp. Ap-873]|nr:hypothetical protein [Klebsiella sp. Ap-873]
MSALEQWDDDAFTNIMLDMIKDEVCEQINLAAERGNEQISWDEFGGDYQ